jgi:3',5'-cyclic-AMP phosphodiesterase
MLNQNKNIAFQNIIQISDVHFTNNQDDVSRLTTIFDHIKNNIIGNKIICFTGDLVLHAEPILYQELAKLADGIGCDIYAIPGNHDDKLVLNNNFIGANIHHEKEINFGNWLVIFLDSSNPGANLGSGKLLETDLEYLEKRLSETKNKKILIFIHHPPILFGAQWFRKICLEDNQNFNHITDCYHNIKAIIFGHAHTQYNSLINNKLYICAPSAWLQFNHLIDEKISYKQNSIGYNWYGLSLDGSISFGTNYI